MPPKDTLLVALGGNALVRQGQVGTVEEQFDNLRLPLRQIARLSRQYRIIITHGNGPQVGHLLLQQEACDAVPRLPLEILVAQTQGQIGYMLESTLESELLALGVSPPPLLVSLISYVVVDERDAAFQQSSKPIGPVYTAEQAALSPTQPGRPHTAIGAWSPPPSLLPLSRSVKSAGSSSWTFWSSAAAVAAFRSSARGVPFAAWTPLLIRI